MNIQIRTAYTTNKNTAESDLQSSVLHTVESLLDVKPVKGVLHASDPMEAIDKAKRSPSSIYWKLA
jgi:hypothetical protein